MLYVATGLVGYFVLLASVWALDAQLDAKMKSFDLDGDGGFSAAELTPEAEQVMDEWASDTGRTFAPIVGIPITAILYAIAFAVVFGSEWIVRALFMRKRDDLTAKASPIVGFDSRSSDNPYQPPSAG
jgi:hypothetical protein